MNFNALLKISPVFVMAGMMISGFDVLIAAPVSTIFAAVVAAYTEKLSFKEILDSGVNNVKEMQIVFFILMAAYAMAETFMATGVGASIINLSLSLGITAKSVAVVALMVSSILSIATGTSWGTFAASAPIFLWLNHILGGNVLLTLAAIAGGSCFGDNIGLISDTTVVSSGIQGVEVIKRIRHQGVWSALVLVVSAITFYLVAMFMGLPSGSIEASTAISQIPAEVWEALANERASAVTLLEQVQSGVPIYMTVPLIIVLILAVKGIPTLGCLFAGITTAFLFGRMAGTVAGTREFLDLIYTGFEDAGSWVIIMMMWVAAFGGIMKRIDAFRPLSNLVVAISRNVRQLMFYNGVLSILGNAALSDEMAQIVTVGPIIRELVEKNVDGSPEAIEKLRLRNATFSDALGVFGSQLVPWHVYVGFFIGIANAVYPLHHFVAMDMIRFNIMAVIAVFSILFLTLTGMDRFIPLFALPSDSEVTLKKHKAREVTV
ncbi:sodium:proton antiporter [Propionigenium maris DSM 9537]|uniref:Sodium:proton antiporter n=1 Tax=Propionigenium maris DSM 9537 TaxID=1123000 RepID=A0A9W6GP43_9FUSO|nr:Na+/H+ antiporter NhaC family protein [Propionigenium maris]GLI57291.1 sodium:proton antiporter [Propionigenium maris DSM 9537]